MTSGQKEVAARVNASIICKEVRLIDADGNMVGIVSPEEANIMASEAGLDLVEISPNATPPVCKIMDFGKFKYDQQKREAEARKKQKTIEMRSVTKFLENGDKVKITLRFRGREMAHQELGAELMERVVLDTAHLGKPDVIPKVEGRQMIMIIYPNT
jgi:translation initiation factor IF-3